MVARGRVRTLRLDSPTFPDLPKLLQTSRKKEGEERENNSQSNRESETVAVVSLELPLRALKDCSSQTQRKYAGRPVGSLMVLSWRVE